MSLMSLYKVLQNKRLVLLVIKHKGGHLLRLKWLHPHCAQHSPS